MTIHLNADLLDPRCWLAGLGDGQTSPRKVDLPIVDPKTCENLVTNKERVTIFELCAGADKTTCNAGEDGAALVCQGATTNWY